MRVPLVNQVPEVPKAPRSADPQLSNTPQHVCFKIRHVITVVKSTTINIRTCSWFIIFDCI